jgi:exosortase family protein XrtF
MVYLNTSFTGNYYPDFITNLVARQSSELISSFGYEAEVMPHDTETSMKLYINQTYLARIVEGCNAVSIIILFIAFIISFSEKLKKTVLFLFAGGILIYAINILRIAILAIAIYKYPEYTDTLHGVVFPAIIYGMVFFLWMIWVRMLPKTTSGNE